jgi:hypothetical protein
VTDLRQEPTSTRGPIDLRLPADPLMSKVLRLTASGIASLGGFDVAEIEEIKLAVSEVLIALVEHGSGPHVEVRFLLATGEFVIHGSTPIGSSFDLGHADLNLSQIVLADVCSEHRLEVVESELRIFARLRRPFPSL